MAEALWLPVSRCGPACLPTAGAMPGAGRARTAGRLLAVATVVLLAVVLVLPVLLLVALPVPARWRTPAQVLRRHASRVLARSLLRALGVRHRLRGRPPRGAALIVANHVSWLDVLALHAYLPVRLVAKREVRGWPVVGRLATTLGTIFVDRTRPRSLPGTVAEVAAALRGGARVAVFPEGTTWCGRASGRFRPALFQAAADTGAVVVPVTLRFAAGPNAPHPGAGVEPVTTVAAFVGDDDLLSSLLRVASTRTLWVDVQLRPALRPAPGACRRTLARAAHAAASTGTRADH